MTLRRRKKAKARNSPDLAQLSLPLASGCDYFEELVGIGRDAYGRIEREAARELWHEHGADLLAMWSDPASAHYREGEPWALAEFGPPPRTRRAGAR
jgi:hypothetical protein